MGRTRQAEPELTPAQELALAALLGGASEAETAAGAGVTVAELRAWLDKDAGFVAEGNRRRRALWDGQTDRLRGLLPKALDALAAGLDSADPKTKHAAALAILRACGLAGRDLTPTGPTSARGVTSDFTLSMF